MTAKRFEINKDMNLDDKVETYELSCIVDNSNKTFYFVVDSIANVESFVERLNELDDKYIDEYALRETLQLELQRVGEENEQLKSLNQYLIELLRETGATVEIEEVKMND